jgi:hypothetical protein
MTVPHAPDPVDSAFVARRRPDLVVEELDGEALVYDEIDGSLHRLDTIATLVWSCLDGTVSVSQLAAEFSEAFDTDRTTVEHDLLATIRTLRDEGLLMESGVASGAPNRRSAGEDTALAHESATDDPRLVLPPPGGA